MASLYAVYMICVKLANLKDNSKLLLELPCVQHRSDFAPKIKHTSY